MDRWREVWARSERWAVGGAPDGEDQATVDRYGRGELAERLERRVAELLGKDAAVWMPSGTMAQQIALRIHAERRHVAVVAFHPLAHLEQHEERGYQALHDLRAITLGSRERLVTAADVEKVHEPFAALLLELPQRDLGGALPPWDDLVATCAAARAKGAAVHLDGARLWQCEPFYERAFAEIASHFDSVYVSFYKDLRAPAGCALAGTQELVDEARVWQVRHGGRLFRATPYLLAAERGLDELLPQLPAVVSHTRSVGEELGALDGVTTVPRPPQTAMFHLLVRRPLDALNDAVLAVAEESGTWVGTEFSATGDPERQRAELAFSPANLDVPVSDVLGLWQEILGRAERASG